MCGVDFAFDMLHSKQLAVNNKQMANDKVVETDAKIGRKQTSTLSCKSFASKAFIVCLINRRSDKTQNSCRFVRVANAAAAAIRVCVKERKRTNYKNRCLLLSAN